MNKQEGIITMVIAFALGVLLGCSLSNWFVIRPDFFKVRLIEMIQLVAALVIAVFITYIVRSRLGHEMKKRELFYDLINRFQQNLNDVMDQGYLYIDGRNKLTEKK